VHFGQYFVFLGRLGLGNEDDCAAPQKVRVAPHYADVVLW